MILLILAFTAGAILGIFFLSLVIVTRTKKREQEILKALGISEE